MAEKEVKSSPFKRITERERLRFIGFDVFPGEPKELFKSDEEKEKYLATVRARHEKHDHLREECTLLEERVSGSDRMFLTIASILVLVALVLPWYTAYNEFVEESTVKPVIEETTMPAEDAGAVLDEPVDPTAAPEQAAATQNPGAAATSPTGATATADTALTATPSGTMTTTNESGEELITAFAAKKKIRREYERITGVGGIIALGSIGSYLFSSGIALILTVALLVIYTLLCIGLPIYNLYGLYGLKGDPDQRALKLKQMLRYNWIPLLIFIACLLFSFFGQEYSFNAAEVFTSIDTAYSPVVFLGTLSWGVFVSLACFILCAAKGAEI